VKFAIAVAMAEQGGGPSVEARSGEQEAGREGQGNTEQYVQLEFKESGLNRRRSWSNDNLAVKVTEVVKGGNRYSHCATGRNTSTSIRWTYVRALLTIANRFALWQLIEMMRRCYASRWQRSWFTQW